MENKSSCLRRGCYGFVIVALAAFLLSAGLLALISQRPELGAQGADRLRSLIGDRAVAALEMAVFQVQDGLHRLEYRAGIAAPVAPWMVSSATTTFPSPIQTPQIGVIPTLTPVQNLQTSGSSGKSTQPTPSQASQPPLDLIIPPATSNPPAWQLPDMPSLGSLPGEGVWSPYIKEQDGRIVAYRTFLQPDPDRPFAVVAIVAFDLAHTRLHYVLGFEEPYSPTAPKRSGAMPEADKAPGVLLAMFNGGFKATHGQFGAMADGVIALPPRDGIGTLAIYNDGRVKIGIWGEDIQASPDLQAWRQNGPLVVQDGQIDPEIYNNSPKDWGYTVKDVSPTLRSGIGISRDAQTLYYFAGPSLSMEALAKSMVAAGVYRALQLDINNYWVHFVAVQDQDSELLLEPLLPDFMKENIDRYLFPHGRDFFYVTAK
jgi:Phosphodiester glycosidase